MNLKNEIENVIRNIHKEYQENELVFLALTSKVENPLRDKIAFKLHQKFKANKIICCEWTMKSATKKRTDLAILDNIRRN